VRAGKTTFKTRTEHGQDLPEQSESVTVINQRTSLREPPLICETRCSTARQRGMFVMAFSPNLKRTYILIMDWLTANQWEVRRYYSLPIFASICLV
jgi:hypothetical protein